MRSGAAILLGLTCAPLCAALAMVACTTPSIGDYPEGADLPPRQTATTDEEDAGETSGKGKNPTAVAEAKPTLTVTLTGAGKGTVSSTPSGLTCDGTKCKGEFTKGTTVTLIPNPTGGAVFGGWTGACTGATSCSPVVDKNIEVSAEFTTLGGSWAGPYTHTQKGGNDCTFNNKGDLTTTITDGAGGGGDGGTATSNAQVTGLELRDGNCNVVEIATGSTRAPVAMSIEGTAVTGTWPFVIDGVGTLPLPFSATISGSKMEGKWTCNGCTGSFTLTKK